jgi:acetyl esterase/lipase
VTKSWISAAIAAVMATGLLHAAPMDPVFLWPGPAPGALGEAGHDRPSITPFLPPTELASGAALVICPGGGYGMLADHEGPAFAEYLSARGVTCFVLKYRLGSHGYRHPVMLGDAARAVRLVRARAAEWKIDPHRVGIMGSSAGGHLASTLLTHFDKGAPESADQVERQSSRPDLGILCYPVISMGEMGHAGSRKNLLGDNPDPAAVELLSNEKQVTAETPPCFIWHTVEDPVVRVENALAFASALRKAGVPFSLHIYDRGKHGIGLGSGSPGVAPDAVHPWASNLVFWLQAQRFIR